MTLPRIIDDVERDVATPDLNAPRARAGLTPAFAVVHTLAARAARWREHHSPFVL